MELKVHGRNASTSPSICALVVRQVLSSTELCEVSQTVDADAGDPSFQFTRAYQACEHHLYEHVLSARVG